MDCILFSIFYCILIYIFCIFCILKYILNNIVDILFCISQGISAALNRISAALIMRYTYFAYFAYFAYSWQNNCLERLECIIAWFPMTRPSYWCTTTYIHFPRPLIYRRRHLEIPLILLASQKVSSLLSQPAQVAAGRVLMTQERHTGLGLIHGAHIRWRTGIVSTTLCKSKRY